MRKGFTIIELIIYMGLLSILLAVITEIFLSILDLQSQSTAVSAATQDGRYLLSRLNYDLRRATAITQPSLLGQSTSAAQLVIEGINYIYDGSSGNLVLTNDLDSDNLTSVGSRISNLSFTRLGNVGGKNSVQIKFRLTSRQNLQQGAEVRDYETTVGLR